MSLEGNLRDLALPEVCQLLAHTRKSGELRLKAPLAGLSAHILFHSGTIVGAEIAGVTLPSHTGIDSAAPNAAQIVERTTLELLSWNEGEFRFVPHVGEGELSRTGVRLHTAVLLMEGARQNAEWERLSDRIPNARAVPAFSVDVEPRQLPLLNLQPQQWEVLTGVDGQRDLPALARSLGRDLLDVAEIVHALIGTGLLKLVQVTRVQPTQATPPSSAAHSENLSVDLWVPTKSDAGRDDTLDDDADDEIFDPVRVGVITPEGLPRFRTPLHVARVSAQRVRETGASVSVDDTERMRERGDAAARRGSLSEALRHWSAILAWNGASHVPTSERANADKAYAVEAIAVATRLHQLLNANQPV